MMITAVKNTGTTTGGTSHEAKVAERCSLIPLGHSSEAPPSSSHRAIAASWRLVSVSEDWVI